MAHPNQNNRSVHTSYLDTIYSMDWTEKPVDIMTFISDPEYLGKCTNNGAAIYPGWKDALRKIFDDQTKYIIVFTGAMGLGKTFIATICVAYVIYLVHCLKNPWNFVGKAQSGKFAASFFNLNKSMSDTLGYAKLQNLMSLSPWFLRKAARIKEGKTIEVFMPHIDCLLSSPNSQGYGLTGADVLTGILDEVDSPNAGIPQKKKVLSTYEQTIGRFKNRFVNALGKSLGKFFVVTSKQETMGFIDTFIAEKKHSPEVMVFDYALWEVRPSSEYTGKKFLIAIPGDAFHEPKIMTETDDKQNYLLQGYEMLEVPLELKSDFEANLVQEIRNTAGRSIAGSRNDKLFKSETFIKDCFDPTKADPVKSHTINIGLKDEVALIWYLDLTKIRTPKDTPRFIHMDFGLSGDALGLSMCGVSTFIDLDVAQPDGTFMKQRVPVIETDFALRLKAKENDSIPLHTVSKFILDLKAIGFNIQLFSSDLLMASAYAFQVLEKSGITTEYLSVDKTDGPYTSWRDLVYDKRWKCHPHAYVLFEAKNLLHDRKRQKVDHPTKVEETEILEDGNIKDYVMVGSKDLCDAICGSVWQCLKDAGGAVDLSSIVSAAKSLNAGSKSSLDDNPMEHLLKLPDGRRIIPNPMNDADRSIQNMLDILRS